jgi:hypothetical protein
LRFTIANNAAQIGQPINVRLHAAVVFGSSSFEQNVGLLLLLLHLIAWSVRRRSQTESSLLRLQFGVGRGIFHPQIDEAGDDAEGNDAAESDEETARCGYVGAHVSW